MPREGQIRNSETLSVPALGGDDEGACAVPPGLLDRALAGDRDAEGELWRRTLVYVQRLARILCRSKGVSAPDIDDIVQDVLIRVSECPPERLLEIRNWEGWVYTIVRNRVLDYARVQARHDRRLLSLQSTIDPNDPSGTTVEDVIEANGSSPGDIAARRDLEQKVREFIDALPKEKREVCRLFFFKGLKHREIAAQLSMPRNTVGVWIYRLKQDLKRWRHDLDS